MRMFLSVDAFYGLLISIDIVRDGLSPLGETAFRFIIKQTQGMVYSMKKVINQKPARLLRHVTALGLSLTLCSGIAFAGAHHERAVPAKPTPVSKHALATTPSRTSLRQAIETAITTHPDALIALHQVNAAKSGVRAAKGAYLPTVGLELGEGYEYSDNPATRATGRSHTSFDRAESALRVRELLLDGGARSGTVAQRKDELTSINYQGSAIKNVLAFDAAQAYLDVLRFRQLQRIALQNVNAHRNTLSKVKKRMDAGAGRKSDIQLATARLALARSEYVSSRGATMDSEDSYVQAIGLEPKGLSTPRLSNNVLPKTLHQAQVIAHDSNNNINASRAAAAASEQGIKVARSDYFPQFFLDLEGTYNDDQDGINGYNRDALAMVRMTYNLFKGGTDKAEVAQAMEDHAAAKQDIAKNVRETDEQVALAWNGLATARKRLNDLIEHRNHSAEVLDSYNKQFQLGQRTLFDLLNAEQELFNARSAVVNGRFQVMLGKYRLLAAMSLLNSTILGSGKNAAV